MATVMQSIDLKNLIDLPTTPKLYGQSYIEGHLASVVSLNLATC